MNRFNLFSFGFISVSIIYNVCYCEKHETDLSAPQDHKSDSTPTVLQRFKNIISKRSEQKKEKSAKTTFNTWKKNITNKKKYNKYIKELENNISKLEKEISEKEKIIEQERKICVSTNTSSAKYVEEKRIKELNPLVIKYANYVIEKALAEIYKNLTVFINEKKETVANELKEERKQKDAIKKTDNLENLKKIIPILSNNTFDGIKMLDDSDLEFIKNIKIQENLPLSNLFKKRRNALESSKRMIETEKLITAQLSINTELSEIKDTILNREKEIAQQKGRPTSEKFLYLNNLHSYKMIMINNELEKELKESGRNNVFARIGMLNLLENEALKIETKKKKSSDMHKNKDR